MSEPRREFMDAMIRVIAAGAGIELEGPSDVIPYDPRILEGWSKAG